MSYFAAETINNINGINEIAPSNDNGLTSTLTICTEAIENAIAAVNSLRHTFEAFGENYVDVSEETFVRRAAVAHNAFETVFFAAFNLLFTTNSQLETAKALANGAIAISKSNSAVGSNAEAVEKEAV